MNRDLIDLIFRLLFSSIFIALGSEHMIGDDLIQKLMPSWIPFPHYVSILCGMILLCGGILIIIGYGMKVAAIALGSLILIITLFVHAPAILSTPDFIDSDVAWLWSILQRSNFAKNLCLMGVCLMLLQYEPGKWSVRQYLKRNASK